MEESYAKILKTISCNHNVGSSTGVTSWRLNVLWNKNQMSVFLKKKKKRQRPHFANKGLYSQSHGFSSHHVGMWELDHKEGWALKNWCFWTEVLEKTLESSLDIKEIKPINLKGNQPFNIHWKDWCWSWSSNAFATWSKDPEARKDWRQGNTGWNGWMASPTQRIWLYKLWEMVKDREAWSAAGQAVAKGQTWFSMWTKTFLNKVIDMC